MRTVASLLVLLSTLRAEDVSAEKLKAHVQTLASQEFAGRRGAGARKAEEYIRKAFVAAGLKTSVQELPGRGSPVRNVIGVLSGGKEPGKEHVILSAHYDHLGKLGGFVFPGASDNAAGVAALLELARVLKPPQKRDVIFIAFDQEEIGLIGSFAYAGMPVRPLSECAAFLTFDILGRDLVDATEGILFCVGTERSDTLMDLVKGTVKPEGLTMVFAGADVVGSRSDFVAFMNKRVPFLFFSTGENRDYHRPTDTPERLNYEKLHREAQAIHAVARRVIDAPRAKFLDQPAARVDEAAGLAHVVGQLLKNGKQLGIPGLVLGLAKGFHMTLEGIVKRGKMTDAERKQMVMVSKKMISMLQGQR